MTSLNVYIPRDRRQALAAGQPLPDRASGAVLFADISGFTPLTAVLAQELGFHRGAEELTHQLNRVYTALIAQVHEYGGSVINFSGDAITCWLNEDNGLRGIACGLAMQEIMTHELARITTPAGADIPLGIKVAVVSGRVRRFLVGKPEVQVLDVLAGHTLATMAMAEQLAERGEVVSSAEIVAQFAEQISVDEWLEEPTTGQRFAVINQLKTPIAPTPWIEAEDLPDSEVRPWLLPRVYDRLQSGQVDFLAELRTSVALFINFAGIDYDDDEQAETKLNAYIEWVQEILGYYEGTLLQLTIGDKGSYLYAVFGAPMAHEDDTQRAVMAALALQQLPASLHYIREVKIGISQGQIHAGAYGGETRRTYGVMGNEVNIAARLMGRAQPGQILVSAHVWKTAVTDFDFETLEPVQLKGLSQPLLLYAVTRAKSRATSKFRAGHARVPMIGRQTELAVLHKALATAVTNQENRVIIVEGEAGIGKSHLLAEFMDRAEAGQARVYLGEGHAIEKSTLYHAWRMILRQLFGLREADNVVTWCSQVETRLASINPDLLRLAPLLNVVLPLDLPETELTAEMNSEARADNIAELISTLLQAEAQAGVRVLVLEDAHWLDSASWALLKIVQRDVRPLLIVIATRRVAEQATLEYKELREGTTTTHLYLEALPVENIAALLCQRLGVTDIPEPVINLIRSKAEGHPFFSEELAYALRDTGVIRLENGRCSIAPEAGNLIDLEFPNTIQGVITSRIDRLPPEHQLMLKVASVIGRVFAFRTLRDIHPVAHDRPQLSGYLQALEKSDLARLETPAPELEYIFKHLITQEVSYNLLLYAQRKNLHQTVAQWYEQTYADDLPAIYPLLVYHWQNADVPLKTIEYLEKAGEQALRNYANREAAQFFEQALALSHHLPAGSDPLRTLRWRRQWGEALIGMGKLDEGRQVLEETSKLLGYPIPQTTGRWVAGMLKLALGQFWRRIRPLRTPTRHPQHELYMEISRTYNILGVPYYLANEIAPLFYARLYGLNIAEDTIPTPELAEMYSTICVIAGAIPLHGLAEKYITLAYETVEQLDLPNTRAFVLSRSSIYRCGVGQFDKVRQACEEAIAIDQQLGHRLRWIETLSFMTWAAQYQGEFERGAEQAAQIYDLARQKEHWQYQAWGFIEQAINLFYLDEVDKAIEYAESCRVILDEHKINDQLTKTLSYGLLATAYLRQENWTAAREAAEAADGLLAPVARTSYAMLDGYTGIMQVYVALWQRGDTAKDWAVETARVCKMFQKFAGVFPVGQPRYWLYQGWHDWLAGKEDKAQQAWQKSLAIATEMGMRFDEAMAHYHIAIHQPSPQPEGSTHLQQAADLFQQMQAPYYLAQAQAKLRK